MLILAQDETLKIGEVETITGKAIIEIVEVSGVPQIVQRIRSCVKIGLKSLGHIILTLQGDDEVLSTHIELDPKFRYKKSHPQIHTAQDWLKITEAYLREKGIRRIHTIFGKHNTLKFLDRCGYKVSTPDIRIPNTSEVITQSDVTLSSYLKYGNGTKRLMMYKDL